MKLVEIWQRLTADAICNKCDCGECKQVYGVSKCPLNDIEMSRDEMMKIVAEVNEKIQQEHEDAPFFVELTTDDLIRILEEQYEAQ